MTQLLAACARTAPEVASAVSSASAYLTRPSLESFDSATIALRCHARHVARRPGGGGSRAGLGGRPAGGAGGRPFPSRVWKRAVCRAGALTAGQKVKRFEAVARRGAPAGAVPGRPRGSPPLKDCAQAADMPRGDRDLMSRPVRARRVEEAAMMDVRERWGVRAAIAVMALALMLRASAGAAAIAVESTSSASAKTASTLTWSHTVGSSLNRILMVGVSNNNTTRTVSGVTYGGT